ncbi:MAG: hypothetical protein CVU70_03080 [Deltaproteobacteria bacterium HGW-Deltaproteobacteria-5]|nr:MAG: hypothetical protein CVU70_03080 [Deltaproteobacteria bacterium HGW-Deltaproteobacteria-5]
MGFEKALYTKKIYNTLVACAQYFKNKSGKSFNPFLLLIFYGDCTNVRHYFLRNSEYELYSQDA